MLKKCPKIFGWKFLETKRAWIELAHKYIHYAYKRRWEHCMPELSRGFMKHIRTHSLYHQSSTFRDRELQLAMDRISEGNRSSLAREWESIWLFHIFQDDKSYLQGFCVFWRADRRSWQVRRASHISFILELLWWNNKNNCCGWMYNSQQCRCSNIQHRWLMHHVPFFSSYFTWESNERLI